MEEEEEEEAGKVGNAAVHIGRLKRRAMAWKEVSVEVKLRERMEVGEEKEVMVVVVSRAKMVWRKKVIITV